MTLPQRPRFSYNQASLPVKIALPFTLVFSLFWLSGVLLVGSYLSRQLDNDKIEQIAELASLVERELAKELSSLRHSAQLLASDEAITRGTSKNDAKLLQREILPRKSILDADAVMVTDRDLNVLTNTRRLPFQEMDIQIEVVTDLLLGGIDLATVVVSEKDQAPVMIGSAPIRNELGIVGGIILGAVISGERLQQINESIDEQLVVLVDRKVVASTLPEGTPYSSINDVNWGIKETSSAPIVVTLQSQSYLAKAVVLDGLKDEHFEVILLTDQKPLNEAKLALWLFILIPGIAGALLLAVIGHKLAKHIAQPIQEITEVSLNVVKDNNFDLQVPVNGIDEISGLAASINQLIMWVAEYTSALEHSAQTLEARVDERTQELSEALKELQETQSQLIQTEKMSSLGQMVAGVAHEINNPISFIQGNIEPLSEYMRDIIDLLKTYETEYPTPTSAVLEKRDEVEVGFLVEDSAKILNSMKIGTQRIRDIVVSLRNFSRLDEAAIKDVDLCEGLESTLLILSHRLKHGITVVKSYGPLPLIRCSPAQINQVFTNIISNAIDAMGEADSQPKQLELTTRTLSAEQVQVCIRDSGPGMSPEVESKIFDPFFTTKPVGKGTGLGLGICFNIIQQHHGTIEVNSKIGQGTEFVITLPKSQA